jgi:hypothetical protein
MKIVCSILLVVAVAILPLKAENSLATHTFPLTVQVDSIYLENVGTQSFVLRVQGHVSAPQSVRIKKIRFDRMQLGDLPLHAAPVDQAIDLQRNASVDLPPVTVTVFYREVSSLQSVRQAVSDGQAHVRTTARVDLDLNVFQRLLAGIWSSQVEVPVDITVPMQVPGGNAGRAAALTALDAADLALRVGGSIFHVMGLASAGGSPDVIAVRVAEDPADSEAVAFSSATWNFRTPRRQSA